MGFDIQVDDGSSTANDNDNSPDFEANQTADYYLSAGDWKATVSRIREGFGLDALKIYSDDTLEDAGRLLGKYNDSHDLQKLEMMAALFKSTFGKWQGSKNSHAIGLRDGSIPEEDFSDDSYSYAFHFTDLPTIEWEELDGAERENLKDLGIDPSELGFDQHHGGPKLPVLDGERVPIATEDGDEVERVIEMLNNMPDTFSYFNEDEGLVEGDEVDDSSEKVEESNTDEGNDEIDLAFQPEKITELSVNDIKSGKNNVSQISNLRAIKTMLSAEQSSSNTRSSVIDRLKQRQNAIQRSQDNGSDDEAESEDAEDDDGEGYNLTEGEQTLVNTLIKNGDADSLDEAVSMIR